MKMRAPVLMIILILLLTACNLPTEGGAAVDGAANSNNTPGGGDGSSGSGSEIPDFPASQVCAELSGLVAGQFPLTVYVSEESFDQTASGLGGAGCRIYTIGTGNVITEWGDQVSGLLADISAEGWVEDISFSGGGAGGLLNTYRRDGFVCQLITEVKPGEADMCGEEALAACLERLEPGQIVYQVTMDCTPESSGDTEAETGEDVTNGEMERITFESGAQSAFMHGSLAASGSFGYVLNAQEGQQMVVTLNTTPPLSGLVIIFGEDGTVLISDHADAMFWYGELPVSQDYFISVRATPDHAVDYSLGVYIPPSGEDMLSSYAPLDPADCQAMADLIGQSLGVPVVVTIDLFQDHFNQTAGTGCKVTAWGDGVQFPDWGGSTSALISAIEAQGWVEDWNYAAGGAGGLSTAYRLGSNLCIYTQITREISRDLCPGDQPVSACWATLAPEQMTYTVTMICATP